MRKENWAKLLLEARNSERCFFFEENARALVDDDDVVIFEFLGRIDLKSWRRVFIVGVDDYRRLLN